MKVQKLNPKALKPEALKSQNLSESLSHQYAGAGAVGKGGGIQNEQAVIRPAVRPWLRKINPDRN
jgi:hypothetical protein